MSRTFKDIFKCESSWIYGIIKTQKILNSYSWFLDSQKYQITTSVHQASEKYFKYKLFEKYGLDDTVKFSYYKTKLEKDIYRYLNGLRITHSLQDLFVEVQDFLDDDIKVAFTSIREIFSDSYIDLRYPNTNGDSIDVSIDIQFLDNLIKYCNILYSKTGCSGLSDTKKFFKELKEIKKAKEYYKESREDNKPSIEKSNSF